MIFHAARPSMHYPILDVKSHWGKEVASPQFATASKILIFLFHIWHVYLSAWRYWTRCWALGLSSLPLFFLACNGPVRTVAVQSLSSNRCSHRGEDESWALSPKRKKGYKTERTLVDSLPSFPLAGKICISLPPVSRCLNWQLLLPPPL